MKAIRVAIFSTLLALSFVQSGFGQEWARFRGPNGTGLGKGANLPVTWTDNDYLWRVSLPGVGHSSPVLWAEKLFITSADPVSGKFIVSCWKGSTGAKVWQKDFPLPHYALHANNNFASASPAADAERVFVPRVENGDLLLTALTHGGEIAWEFKAGPFKSEHGLGHSPMVYDNRVLFVDDQDLAGRVVALDAATGQVVWQAPRSPGRADYSTPCIFQTGPNPAWLILNSHEDGICALDMRDGSLVWKDATVLDKRSVSSPVVAAGLIIGSCGSGGGGNYVVALRPPEQPGKPPVLAYEIRRSAPYVPTPVAVGELLFFWSDGGIVTCVEAATGAVHWQQRVGGNFFSSPICVEGKLYGTSTAGEVIVLAAAKEFKELGRSSLGEATHATPAVANDKLYFRTLSHLAALGPKR